jgi:hypothetical protein
MLEVISGLHKGKIGKVKRESPNSYTIKVGEKEIIVLKSRCVKFTGESQVVPIKKIGIVGIGKLLTFNPLSTN